MRLCFLLLWALCGSAIAHSQQVDFLGDPLPEHALMRLGTERFVSPGGIKGIAVLNKDSIVVTVGSFVTGWDAETGRQLWRHPDTVLGVRLPTSYGVKAIARMSDDLHFMTPGPGRTVLKWDCRTGEHETFLPEQTAFPFGFGRNTQGCVSIDASSDGTKYAFGNAFGLRVLKSDGSLAYSFPGAPAQANANMNQGDRLHFGGPFNHAIFSPDNKTLAHVNNGQPKSVVIRDAATGKEIRKIDCKANVVRMDFSPDGKQFATTQRDTSVRVYDLETAKLVWEYAAQVDKSIENYTSAIRYSPDGSRLAVGERQQNVFVLDAATAKDIGKVENHSWNPWAIAFSSDGESFFSSGWGGVVHRWNTETQKQIAIPGAVSGTSVVGFSHDGKWIAHVDQDGNVRLIDALNRKEVATLKSDGANYEYIVFSPDNQHLAVGGNRGDDVHLAIWNHQTRTRIHEWDWKKGRDSHSGIEEIDFSHDGTMVAAASFRQDKVHVWKVGSGKKLPEMRHKNVYGLCFTPDDTQLVTVGWDKIVRRWNIDALNVDAIQEFVIPDAPGRDSRMYTVAMDISGEVLATTQIGSELNLWNADDQQLRHSLKVQGRFSFGSTCFSRDGLWIVSGASGELQIWDAWSGTEMHQMHVSDDSVYTVEFGADNRTLVTGASSLAYQWDLRPAIEDRALSEHVDSLIENDDASAYQAWWALVDGKDEAVELIEKRIANVNKVVDVSRLVSAAAPEQRERRRKLLTLGINKKNDTLRMAAFKRLASVLRHINSDRSSGLLKDIGTRSDQLEQLAGYFVLRVE